MINISLKYITLNITSEEIKYTYGDYIITFSKRYHINFSRTSNSFSQPRPPPLHPYYVQTSFLNTLDNSPGKLFNPAALFRTKNGITPFCGGQYAGKSQEQKAKMPDASFLVGNFALKNNLNVTISKIQHNLSGASYNLQKHTRYFKTWRSNL